MAEEIPTVEVAVVVNGVPRAVRVEPRRLLVQLLREDLGLTGTHVGCDTSQCGTAAVVTVSGGRLASARVGITGVGEVPYRASAVEQLAVEDGVSAMASAAAHAADGQDVASDIHADADYRTAMASVITRRALEAAFERAG